MRKFSICNWTLQRKIHGMPKQFLGSEGFVLLSRTMCGAKFNKERNDQIEINIDLVRFIQRDTSDFVPTHLLRTRRPPRTRIRTRTIIDQARLENAALDISTGQTFPMKNRNVKGLLSNCTDTSVLLKIIGVKSKGKVNLAFKCIQEKLGMVPVPGTGMLLREFIWYGHINKTNIVITWTIPPAIIMDFDLVKLRMGNRCTYHKSKMPLMVLRFNDPPFVCNVARSGKCTIPGLKTLKNVASLQRVVEDVFLGMWSHRVAEEYRAGAAHNGPGDAAEDAATQFAENVREEADRSRLHLDKTENFFGLLRGDKIVRLEKYFNMSNLKKPKRKFESRIAAPTSEHGNKDVLCQCIRHHIQCARTDIVYRGQ